MTAWNRSAGRGDAPSLSTTYPARAAYIRTGVFSDPSRGRRAHPVNRKAPPVLHTLLVIIIVIVVVVVLLALLRTLL